MARRGISSWARGVLLLACVLGLVAGAPVAMADPALDEYTLDIPKPDGEQKFDPSQAGDAGSGGGASPSAGSPSSGDPISPGVAEQLEQAADGDALREIAADPAFGAPQGTEEGSSDATSAGGPEAVSSAGTDPLSLGLIVGLLCIAAIVGGALIRRSRRASP